MRVHDSQAYRKMNVTRERISRILELREILLSINNGLSLVNAAVACAILQSNSGLEPSSVITEPRYLKLVTVSSFCPYIYIYMYVCMYVYIALIYFLGILVHTCVPLPSTLHIELYSMHIELYCLIVNLLNRLM